MQCWRAVGIRLSQYFGDRPTRYLVIVKKLVAYVHLPLLCPTQESVTEQETTQSEQGTGFTQKQKSPGNGKLFRSSEFHGSTSPGKGSVALSSIVASCMYERVAAWMLGI